MMTDLVRDHIGLGEIAGRGEAAGELVEEGGVEIDAAVGRAVERAHARIRLAAAGRRAARVEDHARRLVAPAHIAEHDASTGPRSRRGSGRRSGRWGWRRRPGRHCGWRARSPSAGHHRRPSSRAGRRRPGSRCPPTSRTPTIPKRLKMRPSSMPPPRPPPPPPKPKPPPPPSRYSTLSLVRRSPKRMGTLLEPLQCSTAGKVASAGLA